MGTCLSTHGKSKCHHVKITYTKQRKGSKGYANFVIPVTRSSLGNATHKYELGKNAQKEIAHHGKGNAFLIERPITHLTTNGNDNGHIHLEHYEDNLQYNGIRSPSSRGSKSDIFFDIDNAFNNESDDEFMSVFGGDFSTSSDNGEFYLSDNATGSKKPTLADKQVEMKKVDDWMVGTSEEVGSLHNPPPEDEHKSTPAFGLLNGIAALAGSVQDELKASDKSLEDGSPIKSFQMMTIEDKVTPSRHKWERVVSDLLGRNNYSLNASPSRNVAHVGTLLASVDVGKASDQKGIFDGLCLPRLRTTMTSSRSRPLSPQSFKKKSGGTRFSFKRRNPSDLHDDHDLSSKYYVERPFGGSQVSHCSLDKPINGCWSEVSPSIFKLRGKHYAKDKKKFDAPNFASFVPIGVDLLMSTQKIHHIAQYVELPFQESVNRIGSLPAVFIVNIQLPLYPPSIFMGDTDGEGLSLVFYFKLSEDLANEASPHLKEILRKFVNDEMEKVKGFVGESVLPYRDRLKIVARLVNPEEVQLSAAEKKLLVNYNEKPILSRPQHCFHKGANYLEVDLDVHRFSFIARKGFDTFRERLKHCVLDVGLTIQATRPEELPEQILGAIRLHKLDFGDYRVMYAASGAPSLRSDEVNGTPRSP